MRVESFCGTFVATVALFLVAVFIQPTFGAVTAPSNLTATAVDGVQINLRWTDRSGNETGFKTYVTTVATRGTNTYPATTTVPWDTPTLNHYRNFLRALANHPVFDSSRSKTVPLKDHPVLGPMRVSVIGRDEVCRDIFRDLFTIPSYTDAKYVQSVIDCTRAVQDEFPSIPLHVGFFSLRDDALDSALLEAIATEFNGELARLPRNLAGLINGTFPRSSGMAVCSKGGSACPGTQHLFQTPDLA